MTVTEWKIFSKVLCHSVRLRALLPDADAMPPQAMLLLLHGFSDDCDSFLRNTALERYCAALRLCVVMPDAGKGFYTDMKSGDDWWRFFTQELQEMLNAYLPPCPKMYLGGVSMGGYGALKLALHTPKRFARLYLFSPLVDVAKLLQNGFDRAQYPDAFDAKQMQLSLVFDEARFCGSKDDVLYLLKNGGAQNLPPVRLFCGTQDFLRADAHTLHSLLLSMRHEIVFSEYPGMHDWPLWEPQIAQMIQEIAIDINL